MTGVSQPPSDNCVPQVYISYRSRDHGGANAQERPRMEKASPGEGVPPCPNTTPLNTANTYDIESEHAYIMTKAIKSYNHYRDKENRHRVVSTKATADASGAEYGCKYVFQLIPKRVLNVRPTRPTRPKTTVKRPAPKRLDAISEVGRANQVEDSSQRSASAPRIVFPMERILKAKNYVTRRRQPMKSSRRSGAPESGAQDAYDRGAIFSGLGFNYRPRSARSADSSPGKANSLPPMSKSSTPRSTDSANSDDVMSRSMNESGLFSSIRSPKKPYFTIHPEWASEHLELKIEKLTLHDRTCTFPPRRCTSAPPPRSRNPITWQ